MLKTWLLGLYNTIDIILRDLESEPLPLPKGNGSGSDSKSETWTTFLPLTVLDSTRHQHLYRWKDVFYPIRISSSFTIRKDSIHIWSVEDMIWEEKNQMELNIYANGWIYEIVSI